MMSPSEAVRPQHQERCVAVVKTDNQKHDAQDQTDADPYARNQYAL